MGCIACAALVMDGASLTLTRKSSCLGPVVVEGICPDRLAGRGQAEIAALPVVCAGTRLTLGDAFEVDGAGSYNIAVRGDLADVEGIGHGMTMGQLTVVGDAGAQLGAHMSGGEILVEGAAGDGLGAAMSGGRIVVDGSAGREAGAQMHGGLIVVLGDAGESAGEGMDAGTIVVGGRLGERPGTGMKRGTIVAFGEAPELPPAFTAAGLVRLEVLQPYLPALEATGHITTPWIPEGEFRRFVGDAGCEGEGEVLVRAESE